MNYTSQDKTQDEVRADHRNSLLTTILGCAFLLFGMSAFAATIATMTGAARARTGYLSLFALIALFGVCAHLAAIGFGQRFSYPIMFISFGSVSLICAMILFHKRAEA